MHDAVTCFLMKELCIARFVKLDPIRTVRFIKKKQRIIEPPAHLDYIILALSDSIKW